MEGCCSSYFGVNPISGKASSSSHHEVFLAKQNSKVTDKLKLSIFSAPESVLIKTLNCDFTGKGVVVVHPEHVLIKTSTDNTVVCRGVTNHWTEVDWTGLEETHKNVKLINHQKQN